MGRKIARQLKGLPVAGNLLALALGAAAVGAIAVGALAIGRMAVGRLVIRKARFGALEVDELTVRKLHVARHEGASSEDQRGQRAGRIDVPREGEHAG